MVESGVVDRLFEFVAANALFRFHVRAHLTLPQRLMVESLVVDRLFEFGAAAAFFRFHVRAHLCLPRRRCGSAVTHVASYCELFLIFSCPANIASECAYSCDLVAFSMSFPVYIFRLPPSTEEALRWQLPP